MKHKGWIFLAALAAVIAFQLWLIQSAWMANVLKAALNRTVLPNSGLQVDWHSASLQMFPPGVALKGVRLKFQAKKSSSAQPLQRLQLEAETVGVVFRPLQILSGSIDIHQVKVAQGSLQFWLAEGGGNGDTDPGGGTDKTQGPWEHLQRFADGVRLQLPWGRFLHLRTESLLVEDLRLSWRDPEGMQQAAGQIVRCEFAQTQGKPLGYEVDLKTEAFSGHHALPLHLEGVQTQLELKAHVQQSGVRLERLLLAHHSSQLLLAGKSLGKNALTKSPFLQASHWDLTWSLQGDLEELRKGALAATRGELQARLASQLPVDLKGKWTGQGELQGPLLAPAFKASAHFEVKGARAAGWWADQVVWESQWKAGELTVPFIEISSGSGAGAGGGSSSSAVAGGKLRLGPLRTRLDATTLEVGVTLERAHSHWLGAGVLAAVYPLDFTLNGTFQLAIKLPQATTTAWSVAVVTQSSLQPFRLTNQRLGQVIPKMSVFDIPAIELAGGFLLNEQGIFPRALSLKLPHSQMGVDGSVLFRKGFNLAFRGNLKLEDLGTVAENEIRGQGPVVGSLQGPFADSDLELEVRFAQVAYLHLALGDLQGTLRFQSGPNRFSLEEVDVLKNHSHYRLQGVVDLAPKEPTLGLQAELLDGDVADLLAVVQKPLSDLGWFPASLRGPVTGTLRLDGVAAMPQLNLRAKLQGHDWSYLGEKFQSVQFQGGLDKLRLQIDQLAIKKRTGSLAGNFHWRESGEQVAWKFQTENWDFTDIDALNQLDVPLRGQIDLKSQGQGRLGALDSQSEVALHAMRVRGAPLAASHLQVTAHQGMWKLHGSLLGEQATLDASLQEQNLKLAELAISAHQFDFGWLLLFLNPKLMGDYLLKGALSGDLHLNFTPQASGTLALSQFEVNRADHFLRLARPLQVAIHQGDFKVENWQLLSHQGVLGGHLQQQLGRLSGGCGGSVDLGLLGFVVPIFEKVRGVAQLKIGVSGSTAAPLFNGSAQLSSVQLLLEELGTAFENISGQVRIKNNHLLLQQVKGALGSGWARLRGEIVPQVSGATEFAIFADVHSAKLKVFPFQMLQVSGNLAFEGKEPPYLLSGELELEAGISREKVLNRPASAGNTAAELKNQPYAPPPTAHRRALQGSPVRLNIDVTTQNPVMVQNDVLRDLQLVGKVSLVNQLDTPGILGEVTAKQGQLFFKDHTFQVQSAQVHFDQAATVNPRVDLVAFTEVSGFKVDLFLSGRVNQLKFEFTSHPPLPENEILSLLAIGLSSSDAKKMSGVDQASVQSGEATSLLLHSLGFNRELEERTGFQVQIDELKNPYLGVSAFNAQSSQATVAPSVAIRKQLGDRLSLSAATSVGAGSSTSRQLSLSYRVNHSLSVNGIFNLFGVTGGLDALQNADITSYGVDFKFQKGFR